MISGLILAHGGKIKIVHLAERHTKSMKMLIFLRALSMYTFAINAGNTSLSVIYLNLATSQIKCTT